MNPEAHDDEVLLSRAIDGDLDAEERRRLEERLEVEPDLADELAALESLRDSLLEIGTEQAPVGLASSCLDELQKTLPELSGAPTINRFRLRFAAGILLLVGLGIGALVELGGTDRPAPDPRVENKASGWSESSPVEAPADHDEMDMEAPLADREVEAVPVVEAQLQQTVDPSLVRFRRALSRARELDDEAREAGSPTFKLFFAAMRQLPEREREGRGGLAFRKRIATAPPVRSGPIVLEEALKKTANRKTGAPTAFKSPIPAEKKERGAPEKAPLEKSRARRRSATTNGSAVGGGGGPGAGSAGGAKSPTGNHDKKAPNAPRPSATAGPQGGRTPRGQSQLARPHVSLQRSSRSPQREPRRVQRNTLPGHDTTSVLDKRLPISDNRHSRRPAMTTESSARPAPPLGEPTVGKVLPDRTFTVTDALINDYFEGLQIDRGPYDRGETPVPSMVARASDDYFTQTKFAQDKGHLWMRQEWTFSKPLVAGASYTAHAHIEDIYERRDRTVVNTAMSLHDAGGEQVLTSNHHQSFLLTRPRSRSSSATRRRRKAPASSSSPRATRSPPSSAPSPSRCAASISTAARATTPTFRPRRSSASRTSSSAAP